MLKEHIFFYSVECKAMLNKSTLRLFIPVSNTIKENKALTHALYPFSTYFNFLT